jgi:tetratricopeptide (TPR) repeat protein
VLYSLAKEAALSGDLNTAMAYWKKAYAQDPEIQSMIIDSFAEHLPAAIFVNAFDSNSIALAQLFEKYRVAERREDALFITQHWVKRLEKESSSMPMLKAANHWHLAAAAFAWLGQSKPALNCEQRAVQLAPRDTGMRRSLAIFLMENHEYDAAIDQLNWCLRRNPENQELRRQLDYFISLRDQQPRTATADAADGLTARGRAELPLSRK